MLEKQLVDSLYPGGWEASPDEDLDNFNQATADNLKLISDEMANLSCLRCPDKTVILSDLEREYGIVPNTELSDEIRRANLHAEKYKMESDGSIDSMTAAIELAGFDGIYAYENDPAIDPDLIAGTTDFMTCDSGNAYCDYQPGATEQEAVCGTVTSEGYILANGTLYTIEPNVDSVCDEMFCDDDENNYCNHYIETTQEEIIYPITDDPNRWAHFLIVGGTVTRGTSGEITSITVVQVPLEDREKLERSILKFKPIEKWAVMAIEYI